MFPYPHHTPTTRSSKESLTFYMRDGSSRFYGTPGGERLVREELAQDEAILRVTQEIWGQHWVRYQVMLGTSWMISG